MLLFPATFGHGSFAFNAHLNADGSSKGEGAANNTVMLERVRITPTFRDTRDPYHLTTGSQLGRVHKGSARIDLWGKIESPYITTAFDQNARLAVAERAMRAAFDPSLCYRDSPTTQGGYALDFSSTTTDLTNFPTGIIPLRYYCRPVGGPQFDDNVNDSGLKRFALVLFAYDPRMYAQSTSSLSLSPGTPSGTMVNLGSVPAPLRATITMAGAGNVAFTITRSGVAYVLDLTGMVASDVVVVTMETSGPFGEGKIITKNGTRNFALKTSSPSSWLDVPIGSTVVTISNTTNVTSCLLEWVSARA